MVSCLPAHTRRGMQSKPESRGNHEYEWEKAAEALMGRTLGGHPRSILELHER